MKKNQTHKFLYLGMSLDDYIVIVSDDHSGMEDKGCNSKKNLDINYINYLRTQKLTPDQVLHDINNILADKHPSIFSTYFLYCLLKSQKQYKIEKLFARKDGKPVNIKTYDFRLMLLHEIKNYLNIAGIFHTTSCGVTIYLCNILMWIANIYRNKKDYESQFKYLIDLVELDSYEARYYLGVMYFKGHYVKQDYKKAFEYFSYDCGTCSGDSNSYLVEMYMKGLGCVKNTLVAMEYVNECKLEIQEKYKRYLDEYDQNLTNSQTLMTYMLDKYLIFELGSIIGKYLY